MNLGITGATGFLGAHTARMATKRGWRVTAFTRNPDTFRGPREWDVRRFSLAEPPDLAGLDAVVHFAGESVLGRWTPAKRDRIRRSRVEGTRRVVEGFARASRPPRVLVSGSAIGYYGDTGDREVNEQSPAGSGFLAGVCQAWEAEVEKVANARVARLRTGFVLGRHGGAMRLVLPVFRACLGGRLGNGRQWMSCVHVDDVAAMALWAVENEAVRGPLNAVMPVPVTNARFTREVAQAVRRPAILPAPAFALRLMLGEMSSLLLASSRVVPAAALAAGYDFRFPDLPLALGDIAE